MNILKLFHILPILFITSCNLRPTARLADGTFITLGASVGTKNTNESQSAHYENGSTKLDLNNSITGEDETVIPGQIATLKGLEAVGTTVAPAVK
jgi:hypothetical protein